MGSRAAGSWTFWRRFPESIVGLFCMGLILSGAMMIVAPEGYRSFYVGITATLVFTPFWAGWMSLLSAVICLIKRARGLGLALVVATFMGRAGLLFTAWAFPRNKTPPPATRWIWEVVIAWTILLCTTHLTTTE